MDGMTTARGGGRTAAAYTAAGADLVAAGPEAEPLAGYLERPLLVMPGYVA